MRGGLSLDKNITNGGSYAFYVIVFDRRWKERLLNNGTYLYAFGAGLIMFRANTFRPLPLMRLLLPFSYTDGDTISSHSTTVNAQDTNQRIKTTYKFSQPAPSREHSRTHCFFKSEPYSPCTRTHACR